MENPKIEDFKGNEPSFYKGGLTGLIKEAKSEGHDGVIAENIKDVPLTSDVGAFDEYIVWIPKQVFQGQSRRWFKRISYSVSDKQIQGAGCCD